MIRAKRLDLSLRTNDDFGQIYALTIAGEPVDLTNITSISMKFRRNAGGSVLATVTPTVVSPATDGQWLLSIPLETSTAIYNAVTTEATTGEPVVVEHDIVFATASEQQVWFYGYAEIKKGITE